MNTVETSSMHTFCFPYFIRNDLRLLWQHSFSVLAAALSTDKMLLLNDSTELSLLFQIFIRIGPLLQEPILIHCDNSHYHNMAVIIQALNKVVMLSTVDGRPDPINPRVARSAVLYGNDSHSLFESLKGYRTWDARNKVIVIIKQGNSEKIEEWLSTAWRLTRAANIAITTLTEPVGFYTWLPYAQPHCNNISAVVELKFPDIFPDKVSSDMQGCTVLGVTSSLVPLVFNETHGVETRIAHTAARSLNLSLGFYHLPPGENVWVVLLENRPVFGLKRLWENQADFMFSNSLVAYSTSRFADFVTSHMEDTWKWFVPGPRPVSRAMAIIRAFTPIIWILFGLGYIIIQISSAIIHLYETGSINNSLIRAFCLNFNFSTSFLESPSFKVFAITIYVYGLHITTAYQASLINFLSIVPREPAIKTAEEVAESKFNVSFHAGLKNYVQSQEQPMFKAMTDPKRAVYLWQLFLDPVAREETTLLATGISFEYQLNMNENGLFLDEYLFPKVKMLKEPQFIWALTMYFSPGHPLVPTWSVVVQRMVEAGIPSYFLMLDGKATVRRTVSSDTRPFGVENVEGAFYFMLVLENVSLIIFIVEIASSRRKKGKIEKNRLSHRRERLMALK